MQVERISINNGWSLPDNTQPNKSTLHKFLPDWSSYHPGPAWQRFKDFFLRPSPLHISLRTLAASPPINQIDDTTKNTLIQAFQSKEYSKISPYLVKIFEKISTEPSYNILTTLFEKAAQTEVKNHTGRSIDILIERLLQVLTLSQLEAAAKYNQANFANAKEAALDIASVIGDLYALKDEQSSETFKQTLILFTINTLEWIIDSFLVAFQLNDLTEDAEYPREAQYRLQLIISMLTAAGSLLSSLSVITGSFALASLILLATTSIMGGLLVIYFKWLKPSPANVPPCINYTSEAIKGNLEPVLGVEQLVDELIRLLCSNTGRTRIHAILIGQSGVGKTEIIKALAIRIAKGTVPDILKNKKVFYINTSDLVSGSVWGKMDNLVRILKKIRKYEKDAIFVFDEIHLAWKGTNNSLLGEKLKTVLDPGPGGLPFVIGATTPEEYNTNIKGNFAFERRFGKIHIESMEKEQTLLVLSHLLYQEAPELNISEAELNRLYDLSIEHFPDQMQPFKTQSLLSKTIARLRNSRSSEKARDYQKLKDEKSYIGFNYMRSSGKDLSLASEEGRKIKERIQTLDLKIKAAKEKVDEERTKIDQFDNLTQKMQLAKQELFKHALKIKKAPETDKTLLNKLKTFLLSQLYINPTWETLFKKCKEEFQEGPVNIEQEFLKVIEEEKNNVRELELDEE